MFSHQTELENELACFHISMQVNVRATGVTLRYTGAVRDDKLYTNLCCYYCHVTNRGIVRAMFGV